VLYVSQPTWTAQIKKLEDTLRLRLLGGRRRMVRNLLPMPERVLRDLNTVQLDVHEVVAGMPRRGCGSPRCRVAPSTADQPSTAERAFVSDRCARSGRA
jgi:DNA-binding transcriptional LysR family regulator